MTNTLEAVVRRRWLSPKDAVREVVAFERRFGEEHLKLACHCGLLLILTPELVNLVRINFLENIPWIAESNFLLSSLCRPLEEGIYEVEPCIREVLLVELENKFGWQRPFELAEFLWVYLDKQADRNQHSELKQVQQWVAKAYLKPDSTIRDFKKILKENLFYDNEAINLENQGAKIPHLIEILADPLEATNLWNEYQYLVNTSRAVTKLLVGEGEGLRKDLGKSEESKEGDLVLISPVIEEFLKDIKLTEKSKVDSLDAYIAPTFDKSNFFAYDEAWVGRENLINELTNKVTGSCRLLILVGMTGIGKTALGERLAVGLEDWFLDWNYYLQVNFDNEEQTSDFASIATRLLEKCKETVTPDDRKDTQHLMNHLVTHLQENRYLIQIDSLENLLQGNEEEGWSDFKDEWWIKFFQAWLNVDSCESRLILTSDELPVQIPTIGTRTQNFWYCQPLSGLDEPEQLELFKKTGLDVGGTAEGKPYLERIGRAYEGHPLALRVIAGEIINKPFNGDVLGYWNKYGKEVEEVEKAIEEAKTKGITASTNDQFKLHKYTRDLRLNVNARLEKAFARLKEEVQQAYLLLCESSVYRCEVPEDFWLSHLEDWDIDEDGQQKALDALRDRYLVEERVDENYQYLLRQHDLIRSVSLEHLRELNYDKYDNSVEPIKQIKTRSSTLLYDSESLLAEIGINSATYKSLTQTVKRISYRAIINWLTKYEPNPNASNLEKVKSLVEAFYHLSQLKEWEKAYKIISYRLDTLNEEQLHNQLRTWGYYREAINLYNTLLNKLDNEADYLCLKGLGNAHQSLAEYEQAIDYFQKSLSLSEQINDPIKQADALRNLGAISGKLRNWKEATNYLESSLIIIQNYPDSENQNSREKYIIEADILGNFGNIYVNLRQFNKAREYLEKSLSIAQEIGAKRIESLVINNLANIYACQKNYDLALSYFETSLQFALESENAYLQQQAYNNLGNLYRLKKDYNIAIEFLKKSLDIAQETGNREGKTIVLENLGTVYANQKNYEEAIKYFEQSLSLARTIGDKQGTFLGIINLNLANLYNFLNNLLKNTNQNSPDSLMEKAINRLIKKGDFEKFKWGWFFSDTRDKDDSKNEYLTLKGDSINMKNTQIFSDLTQDDIIQLELSLQILFMNIDTITGRKSLLKNAGIDDYFISNLDFNLNIREFITILVAKFRGYPISPDQPNYHPLIWLLNYLLKQPLQRYNLDEQDREIFAKILKISQL